MIDAGKAYNAANKQFVSGIRELAQQSTADEVIEVNEQDDVTENDLFESLKSPMSAHLLGSWGIFLFTICYS